MKKIICLLLVFVSAFLCVACDKNNTDGSSTLDGIKSIVESSAPTKIVTRAEHVSDGTLSAMYTTTIDRASGKSQFDFSYQRYATVEEMLPDSVKTVTGSVYYNKDGSVVTSDGDSWSSADALAYLPESLNIDEVAFSSFELLNGGKNLKANVKSDEIKRVFGTDIPGATDMSIEIETNGTYLYTVKVSYKTASGATVVVNTSYDYASVTLNF